MRRFAALEAGGTKMVMAVLDEHMNVLRSGNCPTRQPEETLHDILSFFEGEDVVSLGVGTFGPVDLSLHSPDYGTITNTPKLAWRGFPLLRRLTEAMGVPGVVDTDVNTAVLAECDRGAAKGLANALYLTIGTGIGGGLLCEGRLVHGLIHPEWGHMILSRHPEDPMTRGVCPYHDNCAEGLAAGPAIQARWAMSAADLSPDHLAFDLEAYYLAQICLNALMTVSPQRIILGGGVMHVPGLIDKVRVAFKSLLGGYMTHPALDDLDSYIVPPVLFPESGLIGAGLLAKDAWEKSQG